VLALGLNRKATHEILHKVGKFLKFPTAPALGYAAEPGHPLRHIGLKTDALLFAVIADVDPGFFLFLDDMPHRFVHLGVERGTIDLLAGLTLDEKLGQRLVARQAADMGRKNAVTARDHGLGPLEATRSCKSRT
jgi:hypothetical protein